MRNAPSPLLVIGNGILDWQGAVRLPPGERFQVIHFDQGQIRYRYGNETSPPLYAATIGASPIMVHPGGEIFIELSQNQGTKAYIHVIGSVHYGGMPSWSIENNG